MASKRNRFFALFGALLFLFTSSALTIAVIVSQVQESNKAKTTASTNQKASTTMLKGKPLENFTPIPAITELHSEDLVPGTGETVQPGDVLSVDYTGALAATGIVFESSKDSGQKASFGLSQVIEGWTKGIPGMKVGGTRRLYIPAAQAYGPQAVGADIPANSDLVFDVTVFSTKRS